MTLHAYPVHFSEQMRQHLRSLRKSRGLTQAELGLLLGVSQARIAEIESKPGAVSVEQLMKLLSALGVTLMLQEDVSNLPSYEELKQAAKAARIKSKAKAQAPGFMAYASIKQTNTAMRIAGIQQIFSAKTKNISGSPTEGIENLAKLSFAPWGAPDMASKPEDVFKPLAPAARAGKSPNRRMIHIPPRKGSW